ncbi:hypothetical protein BS47DRAFT_1288171 [Hydnum rufescens UP504]|uniref:Protein kinase domain-containing protein n=1 Tax=Hydnum rufescens UP504 TaxID=1448309 RepID=A0A9P6DYP0_9AGAM|nr:hypothetical protein BS47DRAFT_1288171 [Hydnum rufescens UP504]
MAPSQPQPRTSTLKRKRPAAAASYRSETQVDSTTGRVREVIVIDDTPSPAPPAPMSITPSTLSASAAVSSTYSNGVRTRAQVAAEASGSRLAMAPPTAKRRKKDSNPTPNVSGVNGLPSSTGSALQRKAIAGRAYYQKPAATYTNGTTSTASRTREAGPSYDDKEGHYIIQAGDVIGVPLDRIVRLLGQGTFGKVVEALDISTRTMVAVKIIRSIPKYRDASKIEIRVLKTLKQHDPTNKHKCIHLIEWFDYRNHICIVSELLGKCIYDFLKENNFAPFPRRHIQDFARQILSSVAFLHELKLVHTDLKPENILLVHNDYRLASVPSAVGTGSKRSAPTSKMILANTDVRLIDFGSATFESEYHSSVVCTRHYRAPEIILSLGWSYPCDAFSLGCILVEFYTGVALFQTHDNLEHLAMMEAVMGPMPPSLARKAAKAKSEFFKDGAKLDWPPRSKKVTSASKKEVKATRPLADIIPATDIINTRFQDLVRKLLRFDPQQRITVADALRHPFFDLTIPHEL